MLMSVSMLHSVKTYISCSCFESFPNFQLNRKKERGRRGGGRGRSLIVSGRKGKSEKKERKKRRRKYFFKVQVFGGRGINLES